MLSGVLRSDRAIAVNIEIMPAFELRRVAGSFDELQKRLDQMELDIGARLSEHDEQLRQIFEALRQLIAPPPVPSAPSGSGFARATSSGPEAGDPPAACSRGKNNVWSGSRESSSLKGRTTRVTGLVVAPGGSMWSAWYELDLVVPTEIDGFTLKTPIVLPENRSGAARDRLRRQRLGDHVRGRRDRSLPPRRDSQTLPASRRDGTERHRRRPRRRPLVHGLRHQPDRADQHRWRRHRAPIPRRIQNRSGSPRGPTAASGSPSPPVADSAGWSPTRSPNPSSRLPPAAPRTSSLRDSPSLRASRRSALRSRQPQRAQRRGKGQQAETGPLRDGRRHRDDLQITPRASGRQQLHRPREGQAGREEMHPFGSTGQPLGATRPGGRGDRFQREVRGKPLSPGAYCSERGSRRTQRATPPRSAPRVSPSSASVSQLADYRR